MGRYFVDGKMSSEDPVALIRSAFLKQQTERRASDYQFAKHERQRRLKTLLYKGVGKQWWPYLSIAAPGLSVFTPYSRLPSDQQFYHNSVESLWVAEFGSLPEPREKVRTYHKREPTGRFLGRLHLQHPVSSGSAEAVSADGRDSIANWPAPDEDAEMPFQVTWADDLAICSRSKHLMRSFPSCRLQLRHFLTLLLNMA